MTGQTGQTGQQAEGGVVALIWARFAPQQSSVVSPLPVVEEPEATKETRSTISERWNDARALEVQAAVHARLNQAIAAMPADHRHRQTRLNVLANERAIVRRLARDRDPFLWQWPRTLEHLLQRWAEWDAACGP